MTPGLLEMCCSVSKLWGIFWILISGLIPQRLKSALAWFAVLNLTALVCVARLSECSVCPGRSAVTEQSVRNVRGERLGLAAGWQRPH